MENIDLENISTNLYAGAINLLRIVGGELGVQLIWEIEKTRGLDAVADTAEGMAQHCPQNDNGMSIAYRNIALAARLMHAATVGTENETASDEEAAIKRANSAINAALKCASHLLGHNEVQQLRLIWRDGGSSQLEAEAENRRLYRVWHPIMGDAYRSIGFAARVVARMEDGNE